MIKKIIIGLIISAIFLIFFPTPSSAVNEPIFFKAEVINDLPFQYLEIKLLEGPDQGQTFKINHSDVTALNNLEFKTTSGDIVIVKKNLSPNSNQFFYSIYDKYRLSQLIYYSIGFLILVFIVAGKRTVGSILGLGVSILIILKFIIPLILQGVDPLTACAIGAIFIMFITIFLAHGFTKQTSLALVATFVTLVITSLVSVLVTKGGSFTGRGTEAAYLLNLGFNSQINLQSLLSGSMIIGTLGILEDITTAQTAVIFELAKSHRQINYRSLFIQGLAVGKEHIASLVNTFVLIFTGSSLALLILIVLHPGDTPVWVVVNDENIAQEIARTLVGSISLVLAVPLSTLIAVWFVLREKRS